MVASAARAAGLAALWGLTWVLLAGCGTESQAPASPTSPTSPVHPDFDLARLLERFGLADGDWPQVGEQESNDFFETATPVDLSQAQAAVGGQLAFLDDIDVYDIGPIHRGDRILITSMVSGDLDATAAIFDADQCLLYANDDRVWGVDTRPYINFVARDDSRTCYVALAVSEDTNATGQYGLWVQLEPGNVVPDPRRQVVLLDFDGAQDVSIGGTTPIDVPAFNAAAIDPTYAKQTARMISDIEDAVRDDFADYDVEIHTTADGDLPDTPYTTIYFGAYNSALLGLADYVDYYNANLNQRAIVFIETFSLFMPYRPSTTTMAQVIANVASHELGHLLGLNHAADPTELMDSTATAGQMLANQDFHSSPLKSEVFPIGYQDSRSLLTHAVGR